MDERLRILIDSRDALNAAINLEKMTKSAGNAEKSADKLGQKADKLAKSKENLAKSTDKAIVKFEAFNTQNIVLTAGLAMATGALTKYADAYTGLSSRINLTTNDIKLQAKATEELYKISQQTRMGFKETADLYSRIALSTKDMNLSQKDMLELTETINKSMKISGGTAESMNAAITQLGQAFSSDFKAVGQELASIREQTPALYKAIVDGTGLSMAAFKKAAEEGKLSSEIILQAIKRTAKSVDEDFLKIGLRVDESKVVLENAFTKIVGQFDKATGASATLANAIIDFSKYLDEVDVNKVIQDLESYKDIIVTIGISYVSLMTSIKVVTQAQIIYNGILAITTRSALASGLAIDKMTLSQKALAVATATTSRALTVFSKSNIAIAGLTIGATLLADWILFDDKVDETAGKIDKLVKETKKTDIELKKEQIKQAETYIKQAEKNNYPQQVIDQQKKGLAKLKSELKALTKEKSGGVTLDPLVTLGGDTKDKAKDYLKKLNAEISVLQTDDQLKPFKALEEAYKLDLAKWKDNKEIQAKLTEKYNLERKELEIKAFDDYSNLKSKEAEKLLDDEIELQEKILEEIEKSDNKKLEIGKTKFDTLTMDVDSSNISQLETKLVDLSDTYLEQLNSIEDKNGEAAQKLSADYLSSVKTITDEIEKIKDIDINVNVKGFDDITNGIAGLVNGFSDLQKIAKDHEKQTKRLIKGSDEYNKVSLNTASNQIGAYANMTGAMSSFFTKNEQANKKLMELQRVMFAAQMAIELQKQFAYGTTAMAASLTLPPPASFAAYAATGAMLASLGIMVGGALKGSDKVSYSYDSLSAMKANDGTGTVLGDMLKGSDSIVNSLEILSDLAKPEHELIANMNKSLISIDNKIGGVTTMLLRNAGYALGEGYTGFNTGFSNNVGISSNMAGYGGAMALGTGLELSAMSAASAGGIGTSAMAAMPWVAGALVADKLLLNGAITGAISSAVGSIVGGLFGKSSTSQALTDSGLIFADQLITKAMDDFYGSAYQTIATTVSKKSWFSSSSSTYYNTYTQAMDEEIRNQFELILTGMYDSVIGAAETLGMDKQSVIKDLDDFVVSLGKISLKGKTGEEMQELLSSVFGKTMDEMVTDALNNTLDGFQKVGETISTTLTRVASGMEEAEYYITRLGYQFEDIDYKDIINQQGEVGVEALKQSLLNYEEAYYQSATGIDEIVQIITGTTEEIYNSFVELDKLRNQIAMIGQDVNGITLSMIRGAGGISELSQGMSDYFDNFLTEAEQSRFLTESMEREFSKLNLTMPETNDEFKALIQGLDLSTESGQDLFGRLILLSDGFNEMEEAQLSVLEATNALIDSFDNMGDSIQDTIDKLLGVENGTSQTQQITDFWNKKAQAETLLAKGKDLSEDELSTLENLIGDINSLATSIQSGTSGSTSNITSNLVSELMLLQGKLPSFAVGSSYIPNDMVAQVHSGEMIIPKDFASAIRQNQISIGGGNNSFDNGIIRQELRLMNDKLGKVIAIQDRALSTQRAILSETIGA